MILRILTALLLLAAFLPALFWSPPAVWQLLVAAIVGVAAFEWARLALFPQTAARFYAGVLTVLALALPYLDAVTWQALQDVLVAIGVLFWGLAAPLWLARGWQLRGPAVRAAAGIAVLLPCWAALLLLRETHPGLLLGVLGLVWLADSAAYFAGRAFGRNKLAPSISPGKTWEGVGGALLGVVAYVSLIALALEQRPEPVLYAVAVVLLYFSVLGDLFESWIKRVSQIKDSGAILPGHGGVLDRIDALTAVLPLAAAVVILIGRAA